MFGDSYGDTGNNDFIPTISTGNFPPYGRDFKYGIPTGRMSNGKLMSDYFVEGLGIKELLPPYLDPTLQPHDLITGVCFGSSGTGLDNLTAQILGVIPFWKQIDYFKDYMKKIIVLVGEEQATTILNEAIYFIVIGTNDFIANYYQFPIRSAKFTLAQYTQILLDKYADYIKELYNLGAFRIAVINVPPLGCLPFERTEGFIKSNGACVQERNEAASGFNRGLMAVVHGLKSALPGLRIVVLDYYNLISEFIKNPSKYGIEVVAKGCCGTGTYEIGFLCNKITPFTCSDASKYLFFDSVHLTQKAYQIISNVFLTRDIPSIL
ncbi:hypothetical protein KI387_027897 [Taxus chinensis]|uniref:GDSL esterase/lipase n=1 Tax=Taxus chinensis TaxID=29808 RepID=A0AA38L9Z4_TAXCH|nr:hypothetical protein KI387_027897 [Taxus chinensis]